MVALAERVGGVATTHIVVQDLECQRHDHRAAMAVHDGLGQAGGAAGINNPQRMVKRQPERLKPGGLRIIPGANIGHGGAVGEFLYGLSAGLKHLVQHHVLYAGQCG